jgi:hypothetical protein
VGIGLAASAGTACGQIVFTNEEAVDLFSKGKPCILCRAETSADDIAGLKVKRCFFRILLILSILSLIYHCDNRRQKVY